jgi:hypothetical protein
VETLNWGCIALMLTVAPACGVLVAASVWRLGQVILGNLAGAAVIFGAALALILRESVEVDRVTRACLDAGYTCWPTPSAFARYAIYASLGLVEVFGVFSLSLRVERRLRNRGYAPEWRA